MINKKLVDELKQKYPVFEYKRFKYAWNGPDLDVEWDMVCGELSFHPKVKILNAPKKKNLDNFVFHLGLAEIFSYWKATCSPQIRILCGKLNKDQIDWWRDLLIKGMGQYFYENKINFKEKDFVTIKSSGKIYKKSVKLNNNSLLIPVGGGKDSAVSLELLKNLNPAAVVLENQRPIPASDRLIDAAGIKNKIVIKRTIDPLLLNLNKQGYLNGHTPISAYMAFLFTLVAYIFGYGQIVVSNERSSNEGNLEYQGTIINHQYSKSFEFEKKFREYNEKYLSGVNYFSFLRPLYELQIMKLFSEMPKYHPIFRSCNVGQKTDSWCRACPKCMSVYLGLKLFIPENELNAIFGGEVRIDKEQLLARPFECVGTLEETRAVLGQVNPEDILQSWDNNSFLASGLGPILKFNFFRNILILGFGREGNSVRQYLQENFPGCRVTVWDQKPVEGATMVGDWNDCDWDGYEVIIKSAGIPLKNLPAKIYPKITSETEIFFDVCPGIIIGVTGTKGKSTTASLIYKTLITAGKKTVLVGNIGRPALDYLGGISKETLVVFELSSHQLQTLKKSPHVAVFTNIYPEHLDYYQNFDDYFSAKKNITKFQAENDYLVYNKKYPLQTRAHKIPFGKETRFKSNLLGQHNLYNISAAKKVAEIFKVSDTVFQKAMLSFKPLPHRLEFVGEFNKIKFYNDSLATIPEATIEAINALEPNIDTIILGGFDRGVNYSKLAERLTASNISNLILFPTTGQKIFNLIKNKKNYVVKDVETMEQAVEACYELTKMGKIALLSCASTSFNLFKDYGDRGDQFKKWVVKLGKTRK